MKKVLKSKNIVLEDRIISGSILIEDGFIIDISEKDLKADKELDLGDDYIFAGFIDIHNHGGNGVDANKADVEGLRKISEFHASNGVTGFLSSVLTDTTEQTIWCIKEASKAIKKENTGAKLLGIHLEGPFLNPKYKGAMPESLLAYGDIDLIREYQAIGQGIIKYMTLAPEFKENMGIIKDLVDLGIVVSLGHSDATYDQTMEAKGLGAKSSTHLMNAMRPIHQHELGIVGASLMSDLYTETIVDGLHLHPTTVNFMLKNKGYERMVGITDCIMAAGLPDGEYMLGVNEVIVKDHDARLKHEDVRAGSTLTLDRGFRNFIEYTGSSLVDASKLFNKNPADLLGFYDLGLIEKGRRANFTIMDKDLKVTKTLVDGSIVYQRDDK
ncbi:MAG: N-acetylglucosamine-6-phosphate deacetylase [Anaerococcus sp.]|nr:N-acetylglucosamine-6-phosphate deacetylase [Anaerococcus sp.]